MSNKALVASGICLKLHSNVVSMSFGDGWASREIIDVCVEMLIHGKVRTVRW